MKKLMLLLLLFALIAMSSCVQCSVSHKGGNFRRVDVAEFKEFIANPDVQLVDVRTVEEYNAGHIPGSINIDVLKGHEELASTLDPERPVALYCRSGRRSENAGWVLEKAFFRNVVDLKGGYNEWVNSTVVE